MKEEEEAGRADEDPEVVPLPDEGKEEDKNGDRGLLPCGFAGEAEGSLPWVPK